MIFKDGKKIGCRFSSFVGVHVGRGYFQMAKDKYPLIIVLTFHPSAKGAIKLITREWYSRGILWYNQQGNTFVRTNNYIT